jgi:hypothetical protein
MIIIVNDGPEFSCTLYDVCVHQLKPPVKGRMIRLIIHESAGIP